METWEIIVGSMALGMLTTITLTLRDMWKILKWFKERIERNEYNRKHPF